MGEHKSGGQGTGKGSRDERQREWDKTTAHRRDGAGQGNPRVGGTPQKGRQRDTRVWREPAESKYV